MTRLSWVALHGMAHSFFELDEAVVHVIRLKGMTEEESVGWCHQLNGHEFESTPGVGDGQGGLACCSPWCRKESHMTERLN